MKRIIAVLLLVVTLASGNAFAISGDGVSPRARKIFEKEFPDASYAKWEKIDNTELYQVRFVYRDQALLSFIHEDGTVLGTARNIQVNSLPFLANEMLNKKFAGYSILQVEELTTASEVSYFVIIENEKVKLNLRVFNNGSYNELKRTKKKAEPELTAKPF
jgi:hypothetical protein